MVAPSNRREIDMKILNKSASTFVHAEKRFDPGQHDLKEMGLSAEQIKKFKEDSTVKSWVDAGLMEVEGVKPEEGSAAAKAGLSSVDEDATANAAAAKKAEDAKKAS